MSVSSLENKVALIAGAAGGIGSACALAYARAGASLALLDRDASALEEVARQATAETGLAALPLAADVSDEGEVHLAVARAVGRFGRIDVLVNLAGRQGPGAPVWEVDPQAWRETLDVNLWGAFLLCREATPHMVARRYGRVINVSSGAGNSTMPFFSGYAASKAGVTHFTRTIAEELAPYGVTANALGVRGVTRMWRDVLEAGPGGGSTTQNIRAQYEAGMKPAAEENLPVLLFLASDESRHVTGQYLEANSLPAYLLKQE
jgi:NAD(P)-dependent dehydrogenase (short-subunit alcohol dehydrogenase family)